MSVSTAMRARVVVSSTLGNALEWFDFTVYGMFAAVIGKLYFPAHDPANSLLLAFGTFGIAFVARPVGGVAFGVYADKWGRKRALVTMILLMALGTGLIGIAPPYAAIGLAAPLMVLVARLLQGVSAGGEFGSASAMLIEFATPGRKGMFGSFQIVSQALAFVLGAGSAYLLNTCLSPEDFTAWGWRIPFLLGVLIGPVGIYLRHRVDESPEFLRHLQERRSQPRQPLAQVLREHPRELAVVFCLTAAVTAITYVGSVYLPVFAANDLHLKLSDAQLGLVVTSLISAGLAPVTGLLSDRLGRRVVVAPILCTYCALFYVLLARLVAEPSTARLWQLQAVGVMLGALAGPLPALMTEIFPVGVRSTGASLMYNLAVMSFGGLAPAITTALVRYTGDRLSPVYYILGAAMVGLVGLILHRRVERQESPAGAE